MKRQSLGKIFGKGFTALRNTLGGFGLLSLLQDTLFIRDSIGSIVEYLSNLAPIVKALISPIARALALYREWVYPIFELLPIKLSGIWIDAILSLLLCYSISNILFKRSESVVDKKFEELMSSLNQSKIAEPFNELSDASAKEKYTGIIQAQRYEPMANEIRGNWGAFAFTFFKFVENMMNKWITALALIAFLVFLYIVDLYYRLYFF